MLTLTSAGLRIAVRVQPGSARNRVVGEHAGSLKLQVTARPIDGAANRAIIDLLAAWLGLPHRALAIVQGTTSRDKVVEAHIDDPRALARRIEAALGTRVDKADGPD